MTDILDTLADLDEEDFELDLVEEPSTSLVELDDGDMSEKRAREITEAIRSAATVTYLLLARAHEHNAHKALGYDTWAEYVQTEFDMSAQRSYQLLDLSKVTHEIETVVPEGTEVKLTEAQARDIKRELPLVTEKIREAVDDGEEPVEAVDRIIQEVRDQKKAEEKAIAKQQEAYDEERQAAHREGLERAADEYLQGDSPDGVGSSAEDGLIEVEVQGGDELSPEDNMNLYNFFNTIAVVAALPEPDDFIRVVPANRADEVEEKLMEAVAWFNRFQTLWELREED